MLIWLSLSYVHYILPPSPFPPSLFLLPKCPPDGFVSLNEETEILQSMVSPCSTIGKTTSGSLLDLQALKVWWRLKALSQDSDCTIPIQDTRELLPKTALLCKTCCALYQTFQGRQVLDNIYLYLFVQQYWNYYSCNTYSPSSLIADILPQQCVYRFRKKEKGEWRKEKGKEKERETGRGRGKGRESERLGALTTVLWSLFQGPTTL